MKHQMIGLTEDTETKHHTKAIGKRKLPQQKAAERENNIQRKNEALNKETPDEATGRRHRNKISQEGHRKKKTPQQKTTDWQNDI